MNRETELSGFILSGGKSSRMGFDKALLLVENKPFLQHMIEVVEPFCHTIAISGQNSDYDGFKLDMISDVFPEIGPISGLYSVLKYSSTDWNLIVGVDLPFLDEELFRYLISEKGDYDCIIPKHANGIEPLVGLYNKRILPVIETQIGNGKYKMTKLLSEINTCFIDCNHLVEKKPKLFHNINSIEDFNGI